jgi:hypothetical protein
MLTTSAETTASFWSCLLQAQKHKNASFGPAYYKRKTKKKSKLSLFCRKTNTKKK